MASTEIIRLESHIHRTKQLAGPLAGRVIALQTSLGLQLSIARSLAARQLVLISTIVLLEPEI